MFTMHNKVAVIPLTHPQVVHLNCPWWMYANEICLASITTRLPGIKNIHVHGPQKFTIQWSANLPTSSGHIDQKLHNNSVRRLYIAVLYWDFLDPFIPVKALDTHTSLRKKCYVEASDTVTHWYSQTSGINTNCLSKLLTQPICLSHRSKGSDRLPGKRLHIQRQDPLVWTEAYYSEADPAVVQQKQGVWGWQSATGHADLWDGQ